MSANPEHLLKRLLEFDVSVIVMGSAAAVANGLDRSVGDLDVVYDRSEENLPRLVEALTDLEPYPRGAEPGLDVPWDVETIDDGYSFIMTTTLGDLDLFAEISGIGLYEDVLPESVERTLWGMQCHCLSPEQLIHNLKCSGRKKDLAQAKAMQRWLKSQRD
ncbi:MAG: hypothetical protein AB8G99_21360 [Planctomycetaceae bacterium]